MAKYDEEKSWAEQVKDLYGQITNRPAFSYNAETDPIYQSVRDQYVHQGQRAMEDTLGQAAALTGGYNSSYAQSVGHQAYNEHLTKLNAQIPVLAQQARQAYDAEGDRLMNQYQMAMGMENQEYSRGRDALADQRYDAEWAQQLQAYQDDQNYRNWQMSQEEQDRAYQMVMQMIGTGQVPSADLLAAAGVSADYARSMANYYGRQAALAAGGGSSSRGSNTTRTPGKTPSYTPDKTPNASPGTQTQAQVIKPAQQEQLLQYALTHDKDDFEAYFQKNFGEMKNAQEVLDYIADYILNKYGNGPKGGGGGGKNLIAVQ